MKAFEFLDLPLRQEKPRLRGITMVLDKNMGMPALENFLEVSGEFCDLMKFGWGTSRLQDRESIKDKVRLLAQHGIRSYAGGTLGELAFVQGKLERMMDEARELGMEVFEISDGVVTLPHAEKLRSIELAKKKGFIVLSEMGKKFETEDRRLTIEERVKLTKEELEVGAWKVIMEARESGTFGIFDGNGDVIPEFVDRISSEIGFDNVIIEAPLSKQQSWLIANFGNSVNLGNIAPEECLSLETLRKGLRAGTMKDFHMADTTIEFVLGPPGALEAAKKGHVMVVVDALRATSTIVTALAEGMTSVRPVVSIDECVGEVTAGERGGDKAPGMMQDNSPLAFRDPKMRGKNLVITTTNGTEAIKAASRGQGPVLIGALLNATAVAKAALELARKLKTNITFVMAGRNNAMAPEDHVAVSEIAHAIDHVPVHGYFRPIFEENIVQAFMRSDAGRNLANKGKLADVEFCAQKDVYDLVPILDNDTGLIRLYSPDR